MANDSKHPNLKEGTLDRLIESFPSHSHVIDFCDCQELFNNVRELSDKEERLISALGRAVLRPAPETIIMDLTAMIESTERDNENASTNTANFGPTDEGIPRTDRAPEIHSTRYGESLAATTRPASAANGSLQQG